MPSFSTVGSNLEGPTCTIALYLPSETHAPFFGSERLFLPHFLVTMGALMEHFGVHCRTLLASIFESVLETPKMARWGVVNDGK